MVWSDNCFGATLPDDSLAGAFFAAVFVAAAFLAVVFLAVSLAVLLAGAFVEDFLAGLFFAEAFFFEAGLAVAVPFAGVCLAAGGVVGDVAAAFFGVGAFVPLSLTVTVLPLVR
jgi:hypothetical protein